MAALSPFNPDAVSDDREIIPAGNYIAQIIESSLAQTKSGGTMLRLTWEILDGSLAKRRVWENLNIVNQNADAQAIAERSLKRICAAVGHAGVLSDSDALHFKPAEISVAIQPPKGEYGESNTIKGYKPVGGNQPQQQGVGAPAATGNRPWGNAA
ncbi:DUF669 domain-containing protein [Brevundimonas faecalis]|uniref:DUF669 domain-containing protein n=1 Tax=Brevundimonas faecalis TaxID=947378 RepID=UPI003619F32C